MRKMLLVSVDEYNALKSQPERSTDQAREEIYNDDSLSLKSKIALDSNYLRNQNRVKEELKTETSDEMDKLFAKMKSFLSSRDDENLASMMQKLKIDNEKPVEKIFVDKPVQQQKKASMRNSLKLLTDGLDNQEGEQTGSGMKRRRRRKKKQWLQMSFNK